MTTLTPHGDAARRSLDAARAAITQARPQTEMARRAGDMTLRSLEAAAIGVAAMLDDGVDPAIVQRALCIGICNALTSQCMSLCNLDREAAHGAFHVIVQEINRLGCWNLSSGKEPDFSVTEPVQGHSAGHA